jgi:hypothetical protein
VVVLNAAGGIGSGNALATDIDTLVASNSGSGNIALTDSGSLTVQQVLQEASTGSVTLHAGGTMTVTGGSGVSTVTGNASLTASADLILGSGISTASGAIIFAAQGNVQLNGGSAILSSSGNVLVRADADGNGSATNGTIVMSDTASIDAAAGRNRHAGSSRYRTRQRQYRQRRPHYLDTGVPSLTVAIPTPNFRAVHSHCGQRMELASAIHSTPKSQPLPTTTPNPEMC